jgi:hypothetical protein
MGRQLAEASSEANQLHSATSARIAQLEARLEEQKERHQVETGHLSGQLSSRNAHLNDATSRITNMMAAHATEV